MLKHLFLSLCMLFVICGSATANNALWWEGEDLVKSDLPKSDIKQSDIVKVRLSNMDFLACFIKAKNDPIGKTYTIEYSLNIPEDSEYTLYAREYLRGLASPWSYRFDDGKWIKVTKEHPFMSGTLTELSPNNVNLVWCEYGKQKLTKGKHKFEIKIFEKETKGYTVAFDAFLLSDTPFKPNIANGWRKPDLLSKYEFVIPYHWLEGESSKTNNFSNSLNEITSESEYLSANKWLVCNENGGNATKTYKAEWNFISQMHGIFNLWIREYDKKNSSPFSYKINDGSWMKSSNNLPQFDLLTFDKNTSCGWVSYGRVNLIEGENTFKIKCNTPLADGKIKLAIDSILFIADSSYTPHGKVKPGETLPIQKGWFALTSSKDEKKSNSVFKKMSLNESQSGSHGACKVGKNGFEFEDGTKVKFWGMNVYEQIKMDDALLDAFVADAALRGINLFRVNGPLCSADKPYLGKVDPYLLNRLFYFIAACKKNGIYVALANYNPKDYYISRKDHSHPYGMLYYSKNFRKKYKKWARFLLKENPYTQLAICDDPTVVWFEIKNGDDILSDSLERISPKEKEKLEKKYTKWLLEEYGESSQIILSWSSPQKLHPVITEDGSIGNYTFRLFPYSKYEKNIIQDKRFDYLNKRKIDQLKFISKNYDKVNKELISYLKKKCQFKGAISVGNSSPVNPSVLNAVDAHIKVRGDIIAYNRFVKPIMPEDMTKPLLPGSFLKSSSVLRNPFLSPVIKPSVKNKANVVTETAWMYPNACRGESVPFVAAYASLQGHDTYLWYMANSKIWSGRLNKFSTQTPSILGQFPGYALMFRRGDISEAKPVLHYQLNYNDVLSLKDNKFDIDSLKTQTTLKKIPKYSKDELNPFALLVGKVDCYFAKKSSDRTFVYQAKDFNKYVKSRKGIIKSLTNQLYLNFKKGQLTINSPKAQAFIGFTRKRLNKQLKDVTISMENSYGNVLVISIDNKPIASSSHIFIQAFTKEKNNGFEKEKVRNKNFYRTLNLGEFPVVVKNISAKVQFDNISSPDSWDIWSLDADGNRMNKLTSDSDDNLVVKLPEDSMYVELVKK